MSSEIHPAPMAFTPEQIGEDPILHFFHFSHLPAGLQATSRQFCELAQSLIGRLPSNAERSVALRKLLEAKDAAVRANVGAPPVQNTWQERLAEEYNQLGQKIQKVERTLRLSGGGTPSIRQQLEYMKRYHETLRDRMKETNKLSGFYEMEEGKQVRETGGFNQDKDGPIPFY